jgi:osmotically-inducible protein OsmY
MLKLLFGAALGAAAAWFLDPNDGTRRRNVVRDKGFKYMERAKGQAGQTVSYAGSAIKGKASAVAPGTGREPAGERLNDPALAAKVESEIFRDADAPKGRVSLSVEDGIVYLRGELDDRSQIEKLAEAAGKVDGVRGVENLLHTPGEPAPMKDESRHAAGTTSE